MAKRPPDRRYWITHACLSTVQIALIEVLFGVLWANLGHHANGLEYLGTAAGMVLMGVVGGRSIRSDIREAIGYKPFDEEHTPDGWQVVVLDRDVEIHDLARRATGSEHAWVEIVAANLGHRMLPHPLWTDVYRHPRQTLKTGWHMVIPAGSRSALGELAREEHAE